MLKPGIVFSDPVVKITKIDVRFLASFVKIFVLLNLPFAKYRIRYRLFHKLGVFTLPPQAKEREPTKQYFLFGRSCYLVHRSFGKLLNLVL